MLQFSNESIIEYAQDQIIQTLTLTNKGDTQILFKVKTNNIKAIDARPNIGSVPAGSNFKITIKRNEHIDQNVKLQISYLECKDALTKDNFKELWGKHEKGQQSKTFLIKVGQKVEEKKEEMKESKKSIDRFNSILSSGDSDPSLFQSVRVSRNKSGEDADAQKQEVKIPDAETRVKQQQKQAFEQLAEQKAANKLLSQRLTEKQTEMQSTKSETKQLEVDKFLSSGLCKRPHFPYSALAIMAVLIFALGFYFGSSASKQEL